MKEASIIEKQIQHLGKEVPLLILGWSTLIPPEADRTVKDTLVKNLMMENCILKKKNKFNRRLIPSIRAEMKYMLSSIG